MFNGPIDWMCKKHRHVGLSASHNEYMALHWAARSVEWIRHLVTEMGFGEWVKDPTPTLGDNDTATQLSNEDMITPGNKYFLPMYYYSKECVSRGAIISTRRVDTKDNISDLLTKIVTRQDIDRLRGMLTGNTTSFLPIPAEPPKD